MQAFLYAYGTTFVSGEIRSFIINKLQASHSPKTAQIRKTTANLGKDGVAGAGRPDCSICGTSTEPGIRNGATMRPTEFSTDTIVALLRNQTIASLPEVIAGLGPGASSGARRSAGSGKPPRCE